MTIITEDKCNDTSSDQFLRVAAKPLNSLNPAPKDLPDLLDSLITNYAQLQNSLQLCETLADTLSQRILSLDRRIQNLQLACPPSHSSKDTHKDKVRMAHKAQESTLLRMRLQVKFMHFVAKVTLPAILEQQLDNHRDLFEALLGERHDHPGIQVANSSHLHCGEGCRWYHEYGPYEWTKQPYTHAWWVEMNDSDFDWVRVRQYVQDLTASTSLNATGAVERFHGHIRKFVPSWFWKTDDTWQLQTKFQITDPDGNGKKKVRMAVVARYERTEEEMEVEVERRERLSVLRKEGENHNQKLEEVELGVERTGMDVDEGGISIESFATVVVNMRTVFDGEAFVEDWDNAKMKSLGSWLEHWGFEEWAVTAQYSESRSECGSRQVGHGSSCS